MTGEGMIGGWAAREKELAALGEENALLRAKIAKLEADDAPAGPLSYRAGHDDGYAQGYADGRAKRWDDDDPNA